MACLSFKLTSKQPFALQSPVLIAINFPGALVRSVPQAALSLAVLQRLSHETSRPFFDAVEPLILPQPQTFSNMLSVNWLPVPLAV